MVENMEDDPGEAKPNFVEKSGDVKPPKVEAKPNIHRPSVHVEASKYVNSDVLPLHVNEVDTTDGIKPQVHGSIEVVKIEYRSDREL
ncbi:hypothetical protein MTR_5g053380 [Medicago truncatula]|uniref:Uncharacterized protein n=1 Tax=Medicago truncatula TaxID=3880 RepID=G7JX33_MEDTR|nr:hypothetical protein MTR_5g053380 [Medicago truncatula]